MLLRFLFFSSFSFFSRYFLVVFLGSFIFLSVYLFVFLAILFFLGSFIFFSSFALLPPRRFLPGDPPPGMFKPVLSGPTPRITRLRASTASYILRQLGWQDKVDNRGGSKSGSCAC
jgi:hypothetical protein